MYLYIFTMRNEEQIVKLCLETKLVDLTCRPAAPG